MKRPLIERCAYHWTYINTVGYELAKPHVEVSRFEGMLGDPEGFARRICSEVGVNPDECEPELSAWCERVQDTNNEKFIEAKTSRDYSRPDHKNRIGRWRENLSHEDLRQVLPMVRDVAERFGYELPNGTLA